MKYFLGLGIAANALMLGSILTLPSSAQANSLSVVYPPSEHETVAKKIFFIGTASADEKVFINNQPIKYRSDAGHFAPSLPLKIGKNVFKIRHQEQEIEIEVTRIDDRPKVPSGLAFANNSLLPSVDISRLVDEPICFGAVATPDSNVSVKVGNSKILLLPQVDSVELPANSAVLTAENQPGKNMSPGKYAGCTTLDFPADYGKPVFELKKDNRTTAKEGNGEVTILSPKDIKVVEIIADAGVARTGASTSHSRLTPLPKGTKARVTGKEGEWLRLDYGGWIEAAETKPVLGNIPPQSLIRGVTSRRKTSATEIIFPLQIPVPVEVKQKGNSITLTLHNTTAQTDTIRLDANPLIKRLDWEQVSPTQVEYTFELHDRQQWGYDLNYEGTSLVFSLRHSPYRSLFGQNEGDENVSDSLKGIKILLDPGHGGKESGSKGATGYPEKKINLLMSKLIEQELTELGATVYLTREEDVDVALEERVAAIDKIKPDLALSIHYNALPDNGDAEKTQGISTFWYNTQAHAPAVFLHEYLIDKLNRPDYGVYWNNLALTRPHSAPSVLLELGFMINPEEFEWITDERSQQNLAETVAQGIKEWFASVKQSQ